MNETSNPLLGIYDSPFAAPPLDQISAEHFEPAIEQGMREHKENIDQIIALSDVPTFANTIEAMERANDLLSRVLMVFYNLNSAHTNDELQTLHKKLAPKLARHFSETGMNQMLFTRVSMLYEQRESLGFTQQQNYLLGEIHKEFLRSGVALDDASREQVKQINEELSLLTTQFGQNLLAEQNDFQMIIEQSDTAGLSPAFIASAAAAASEAGHEGKYLFTISRSSFTPFMQYADNRGLREKMFHAYTHSGDNDNDYDNKTILSQIAALRVRLANIMGYPSYADFELSDRMAATPAAVSKLLQQVWQPAISKAREEAAELQAYIKRQDEDFTLQPWDWWYYSEKVREQKYGLDADEIMPYFPLPAVRDGAFYVAGKLYGLKFRRRHNVPVYHEDVEVWEVSDADGSHIGLFYADYFMRPSKRGGAWMSAFRRQSKLDTDVRPIIVNVCNFNKGQSGKPALLTPPEVRTLFHEFGHALHGLLSDVTYESLSCTHVKRDFVELPSQIMEHWATEPEVLKVYARHVETGEAINDEMIQKIRAAETFNKGFQTTEYLAASVLDMAWHSLQTTEPRDVDALEQQTMSALGLIPQIAARYRSTYFQHIFSGGYSAGYYSYLWAEVLDADGYDAFRENGLFDAATARSFRQNILQKGGSDDPMTLYIKFRGREPKVDAMLAERGLA
jgi:peptidyl-dipeptidase Dcp